MRGTARARVLAVALAVWWPGLSAAAPPIRVTTPHLTARISAGQPFGIVSLRPRGHPVDFASRDGRPLADWEWFRLWAFDGSHLSPDPAYMLKLIDPTWAVADAGVEADRGWVEFAQHDALVRGTTLTVACVFSATAPAFDVHYTIHNGSSRTLWKPYAMVGFPGFPNHDLVVAVATARQQRAAEGSADFRQEAQAKGVEEYLLLREDVVPASGPQELMGSVTLAYGGRRYVLEATCLPGPSVRYVYSAHTNKTRYLTSHLYVFFHDLRPGGRASVTVHYRMTGPSMGGPSVAGPPIAESPDPPAEPAVTADPGPVASDPPEGAADPGPVYSGPPEGAPAEGDPAGEGTP